VPITLSSRFARRTALAGAAATLSIALAACSASFNAPTLQPYQAAEGTNIESGQLKVRNMLVLADAEGKGELHSVIVNDGDDADTLVSIEQAPAGTQDGQAGADQPTDVKFAGLTQPVQLEPHTALRLPGTDTPPIAEAGATPSATPATPSTTPTAAPTDTPSASTPGGEDAGPAIIVTGAKPGQMVNVTITFGNAAPVSTYIPVLTDDHYSPSPAAAQ
jgi:copper(I)-binding protein